MPSESSITSSIRAEVARRGGLSVKLHGGMYSSGLPDLIVVLDGRTVWIEVKRAGKHPTPLQAAMIKRLRQHGATVVVAHSAAEVGEILDKFA